MQLTLARWTEFANRALGEPKHIVIVTSAVPMMCHVYLCKLVRNGVRGVMSPAHVCCFTETHVVAVCFLISWMCCTALLCPVSTN